MLERVLVERESDTGWLQPLVGGRHRSDKGPKRGFGGTLEEVGLAVMKPGISRWSRAMSGRRFQGEFWRNLIC